MSINNITVLSTSCGGNGIVGEAIGSALQRKYPEAGISYENKGDELLPGGVIFLKLHSWLARHGFFSIISALCWISKPAILIDRKKRVRALDKWIVQKIEANKKPAFIVSVTPVINSSLIEAAKKHRIPVMVIAADLDNKLYSSNWIDDHQQLAYRYIVPFMTKEVIQTVHPKLNIRNVRSAGYPVRDGFTKRYKEDEKTKFRQELNIAQDIPVIPIMMGSLGGTALVKYTQKIIESYEQERINAKAHFVLFCGKNDAMKNALSNYLKDKGFVEGPNGIFIKDGLFFSVLGFSEEVHKYLAVSCCMITKPGPGSISEALCQEIPLILDSHEGVLPWEGLNIEFVEQYGFGESMKHLKALPRLLNKMLDSQQSVQYHYCIKKFQDNHEEIFKTGEKVVEIAEELIQAHESSNAGVTSISTRIEEKITFKKRLASLAKKVARTVRHMVSSPFFKVGKKIVRYSFFSGFYTSGKLMKERRKDLIINHNATPIEKVFSNRSNKMIDAMRIKSSAKVRNGNVVIFVLSKSYQKFHPDNYQNILKGGADVVLFNPTELNSVIMAEDLKQLVRHLSKSDTERPNKILLHGHCVGAHVALSVACDLAQDEDCGNISVISDRGYAEGYTLIHQLTHGKLIYVISRLMKKFISTYYDLKAEDKLKKHDGDILFISTEDGKDKLLQRKGSNLCRAAYEAWKGRREGRFVVMKNATHWSKWDDSTKQTVSNYMCELGILSNEPVD